MVIGCKPTEWTVTDTKFYQEQYLCVDDFCRSEFDDLKAKFFKAGFNVNIAYDMNGNGIVRDCIVLTPAMIEYTNKRGKGILKKRHIKRLRNTL